jgi:hypothetical protein
VQCISVHLREQCERGYINLGYFGTDVILVLDARSCLKGMA